MQHRLTFGKGSLLLHLDGSPRRFEHPDAPHHGFLLDETKENWHTAEHRWGTGFLTTAEGTSAHWAAPDRLRVTDEEVHASFDLGGGLHLDITRCGGETLTETYRFMNTADADVTLAGVGLQTPFRDIYPSAAESLRSACHAHVFTGGSWAWVLAQPMHGQPPMLGLIVREGALWAYSVESRNHVTGSNVRGHLVLQPTDRARNPLSFGGQPDLILPARGHWQLTWELGWYDSPDDFLAATDAPVQLPTLTAPVTQALRVGGQGLTAARPDVSSARARADGSLVTADRHGVVHLDLLTPRGPARTAVLFHQPARTLTERRVAYILRHQRPTERPAPGCHALVPIHTPTRLRRRTSGWADWSDGAERVGMAQVLQQARLRRWHDTDRLDEALTGYAEFVRDHLLDDDGDVRWGTSTTVRVPRLYNYPWLAQFFADQYVLYQRSHDLEKAAALVERSYALGAAEHLSIGQPEAVLHIGELLETCGQAERATRLRTLLHESARHFATQGARLPSHEVNYEQSMVAPLVSLYATVYRVTEDDDLVEPLAESLRWLLAFGGPQPHVRQRHIGLRHWDGYWFGHDRLYGDVFPHHWSTLTAVALTQLPDMLRTERTVAAAEAIFTGNLALFRDDGSATCAFVLPSTVDGRPAHRDDPLANDQDWALGLWLRAMDDSESHPIDTTPQPQ